MKTKKAKKFDAVKMMREIREKLSEAYLKNHEKERQDLTIIRKKHGISPSNKRSA